MFRQIILILFLCPAFVLYAQKNGAFADSIRGQFKIPELAYAVVSSDSVFEMQVIGFQKTNSRQIAKIDDRFRIGSNTKAITGFIAALLVKEGKIKWDTKFFDLFPELKTKSDPAYHQLTLLNLLTFRTRLFSYTYTYDEPKKDQFKGDENAQRYLFTQWFFQQKPVAVGDGFHFSNLGYTAAGLMLEKVSGKSYKELVNELGKQLGISFGFGTPNTNDTLQPWGHDQNLNPEYPAENHKLNWLLAAGNINLTLPDYLKFIQVQLQGLNGQSTLLSKQEFEFLHFGLPRFAVGWFWIKNDNGQRFSFNVGNPGTFLSKVYVYPKTNKAFIFLCNAQTEAADAGIDVLCDALREKYK